MADTNPPPPNLPLSTHDHNTSDFRCRLCGAHRTWAERNGQWKCPGFQPAYAGNYEPLTELSNQAAMNLLAVIHRDGGHHTDDVGFVQSCADARRVVVELLTRPMNAPAMSWADVDAKLEVLGCDIGIRDYIRKLAGPP